MNWLGKIISAGVAALVAAVPAYAAGKFAPPEGCNVYVTVQMKSCQVSQHYRCAGDPPGDQWAVYLDSDGPYYMNRIDSETRWVESYSLISGERDELVSESDPASFTTLLATGRDDYDFMTESDMAEVVRYTGYDQLPGDKVEIDGVELERTRFDLTARDMDGATLWRRSGQQLIHRDWRIFFADREVFESPEGERTDVDDTPVTFAFPGQAGYLETKPQFGCDMMMTEVRP
ncbi:hypothetical protein DEA8626_02688 [Defluviimonas aquaemixtae]|uniref:Uncharacterized protein n=1 Tax=Albidovulum aquaemixtae TaxID=1542388 RepID=A0A2R8BJZ1_9RHOB|nr:hypothetical protein [Defluviimonas aquaemixtae]SPH23622.1 hypothetical protein DEA8626_02688 [Defluviimonas aquaemixtae]